MQSDSQFYQDKLYPLQDKVLPVINACDTDFYLTGWINPPDPDQYLADLLRLGEELILPKEE